MISPYKRTLFDKLGPEGSAIIRTATFAISMSAVGGVIGAFVGIQRGQTPSGIAQSAVIGTVVTAVVLFSVVRMIPHAAGAALQASLMPKGNTTPYETDFSYELALAMKGDVATAMQSFEEKIATAPADATVRLKAAEMYLAHGNAERARELFREVQRIPNVERRDDVTASYRLVDLYRGKLADPAKALPEFRRLIERYPDSQIETQARDALAKLKSEMVFDQ